MLPLKRATRSGRRAVPGGRRLRVIAPGSPWRRIHRDHAAEYAAEQAVAVILAAKVSLRVDQ
jgi:hypothetical protein